MAGFLTGGVFSLVLWDRERGVPPGAAQSPRLYFYAAAQHYGGVLRAPLPVPAAGESILSPGGLRLFSTCQH